MTRNTGETPVPPFPPQETFGRKSGVVWKPRHNEETKSKSKSKSKSKTDGTVCAQRTTCSLVAAGPGPRLLTAVTR